VCRKKRENMKGRGLSKVNDRVKRESKRKEENKE
jgi:hypothetical protein